jgi:hypothetical protein
VAGKNVPVTACEAGKLLTATVPDTGWVAGRLLTATVPLTGCVAGKLLTATVPVRACAGEFGLIVTTSDGSDASGAVLAGLTVAVSVELPLLTMMDI